jgi:hypothetical protein
MIYKIPIYGWLYAIAEYHYTCDAYWACRNHGVDRCAAERAATWTAYDHTVTGFAWTISALLAGLLIIAIIRALRRSK